MNIEEKLREKRWNRYFEKCLVALIASPLARASDYRTQLPEIAAIMADFADSEFVKRFPPRAEGILRQTEIESLQAGERERAASAWKNQPHGFVESYTESKGLHCFLCGEFPAHPIHVGLFAGLRSRHGRVRQK